MESYLVTVTDVSGTNTSLSGTYNTSQCLPITSDLSPDVCGPFMASVVAVNGAGTSSVTVHLRVDPLTCLQNTNFEGIIIIPHDVSVEEHVPFIHYYSSTLKCPYI